jgi:fructosamine-3-kinase
MFEGDPTLFNPWKRSFEAMVQDAHLNPAQVMAYLRNYTGGKAQALVDNFRKRQQDDPNQPYKSFGPSWKGDTATSPF